jgi:hypothetical protein
LGFKIERYQHHYLFEYLGLRFAGPHLRLIDFVYHSTLGLRVKTKKQKKEEVGGLRVWGSGSRGWMLQFEATEIVRWL